MGSRYPSRRHQKVAAGQEHPPSPLVSCNRSTANVFEYYGHGTFKVKSGGFIYGTVSPDGKFEVSFVYEPPHNGKEDDLALLRDQDEENLVEAMAEMFGVKKLGFIFMHGKKRDYAVSNKEILLAAETMVESNVKDWVTVVVNLEDGGSYVHFEAFQMTQQFIELYKEGCFKKEIGGVDVDPKLLRMEKNVVIEGKATTEAETRFFLVLVKMFNHKKMEVGTSLKLIYNGMQEQPHLGNPHLGPIQDQVNKLRARANEGPSREKTYNTIPMGPMEKLVHQLQVKVNDGPGKRNHSCTISNFKALDPPKFNGTTGPIEALKWLKETENILDVLGCCDDQKVLFASFMFEGDARLWWELTKRQNQGLQMSWEKFQEVFNGRYFSDYAQSNLRSKFHSLEQDGMSLAEYESKFLELNFACPELYPEKSLGSKFYYGLHPEIQEKMFMYSKESYAVVVQKAYIAEGIIQCMKEESYSSDGHGNGDLEDGAGFVKKAGDENGAVYGRDFRCYSCGKPGHMAKNCNGPTRTCYKCGQEGHIARYCP